MGQWGPETCSCDSCWDNLYSPNIHDITQEELNYSIKQLCDKNKDIPQRTDGELSAIEYFYGKDKLGVVIWGLSKGLRVDIPVLKECLKYAEIFSKDEIIEEEGWFKPEERKKAILKEIEMIKHSMNNNGIGNPIHIKSLFERM